MENIKQKTCNIRNGTIIVFLLTFTIILYTTVRVIDYQMHFRNEKNGCKWTLDTELKENHTWLALRDELCINNPNSANDQENECRICPVDWKLFQENCYYIPSNNQHKSWNESQAFCEGMKSHLLVIENQEQMIFLDKIIDRVSRHWIGLHFDNNIRNWTWVNCESCKEFQFSFKKTSEADHCVLRSSIYYSEKCCSPNSWICQKKAIRL
ncbi:natural killer cells antigen CD94-like [Engystomops pustulosus]|uniref:natural killer cells antigen CD94-like n=1 Tax=Engystomops pustulosus TaxID=76066 RepID=UPI003AFB37C7